MENTKRRGDGSSPCLQGKSTMESILASRGMITPQKESQPWLGEVQISTLQGAQKPVLSSTFLILHAENTQIHRKTLQEDRHR
jgi:hypothetical protein